MMAPMNKRELARAVAVQSDVELKTVVSVLEGFTEVVTAVVSKGEPVAITGFAKFVKVDRKARMGRNPATGETIRIKASKKARITPVKAFKDAVLAPATAPKLARGAFPTSDDAVKAAGKSAAAAKAPAKKTAARKAPARKTAALEDDSAARRRREGTGPKRPPGGSGARPGSAWGPAATASSHERTGRAIGRSAARRSTRGSIVGDHPHYEAIVRAHAAALEAGADTYVDPPSGLTVLTAGYLARRGFAVIRDAGTAHT